MQATEIEGKSKVFYGQVTLSGKSTIQLIVEKINNYLQ